MFERIEFMKWMIYLIMILAVTLSAQIPYELPPDEIVEIFNRPRPPSIGLQPKTGKLVVMDRESYLPLELLALEKLELGGIEITPKNRALVRSSYLMNPRIMDIATGEIIDLGLEGYYGGIDFSPDERYALINRYETDRITLWRWDSKTGKVDPIVTGRSNQAFETEFIWLPDGERFLLMTVPEGESQPPVPPSIPIGPTVFESSGEKQQNRTYRHLLKNEYDDELFTYYGMTQILEVNARTGRSKPLGRADLIGSVQPSPDGKYLLVSIIDRPFSRKLLDWGFPFHYELWDDRGKLVEVFPKLTSWENIPNGGVILGQRRMLWHPFHPHRILAVEALDGGDPEADVPYRDLVTSRDYPDEQKEYFKTKDRYSWSDFISGAEQLVYEYDRKRRWRTGYYLNTETSDRRVFYDYSVSEKYRHPGYAVSWVNDKGFEVALKDGNSIYFSGNGYREDGMFPFLDRIDLATWEKERVWQSEGEIYQNFTGFYGSDLTRMVGYREPPDGPPNYFLYDFATGESRQLTHFDDPFREVNRLEKRLIRYKRPDGLDLDGMLYLPRDYQPGKRYPMVMTAYPEEYTGEDVAQQSVNLENRYTWLWGDSPLYLCLEGYVVLDDAKIAVVGDPETVNETFIEQVTSSAEAAVDYLDSLGIVDPNRVAVMGHSYGAFMVVNLLAHSDRFAAGIAKNGAYNRTLTPFGFQSERRNLWEARDLYLDVSPFLYADRINEPLLLIHSMEDTNSGTYPMQSERLYDAISQLGGTCRYLQLPLEDHSYRARETHLHLIAEYLKFLDRYMGE